MPRWTVENQVETTETDAAGRLKRGVRVYFKVEPDTHLSVFVPEDQYTPDRVAQIVGARAAHASGVAGLSGS